MFYDFFPSFTICSILHKKKYFDFTISILAYQHFLFYFLLHMKSTVMFYVCVELQCWESSQWRIKWKGNEFFCSKWIYVKQFKVFVKRFFKLAFSPQQISRILMEQYQLNFVCLKGSKYI